MPIQKKEPAPPPELLARLDALDSSSPVDDWKTAGNDCFAHGCHLSAIRCYTKALEGTAEDSAVLRSNRSAAYLKSSMLAGPSLALKDAERAAELEPSWYKAHLRIGDAQFARRKFDEAKTAYSRVLELSPDCSAARDSLHLTEKELFLRSLDEAQRKEEREGSQPPPKPHSEWSANSTMSGACTSHASSRQTRDEDIGRCVEQWKRDTLTCEDRTAMRAFGARLDEADRQVGVAYRSQLLSQFRNKVEDDEACRGAVEARHEAHMRQGEGIDYRNAEPYRAILKQGTDGIGLGISTDAYKSYKYEGRMW